MVFYLGVGILLWALTIPEILLKTRVGLNHILAFFTFWLICAFRFETGYDWIVYEQYFDAIASSGFMEVPVGGVPMEPLYYLLNYVISRIGSFQLLLFVVGSFNAYCACRFFHRFGTCISLGLTFVFCWVFFPLEMGTIRQSLAVSFMLLSMEGLVFCQRKKTFFCFIVAIGFQYSALMYAPIFFIRGIRFIFRYAWVFIALCLLFYFAGVGIGQIALSIGSAANIPFISEKLANYSAYGFSQRSIAGSGFFILNCVLLGLSRIYIKEMEHREAVVIGALICLIGAQAFLFDFALIWNRIQYLACFAQAVVIYSIMVAMGETNRVLFTAGVASVSLAALFFFVSSPSSSPFIPYQSYIKHAITDDKGDGRQRSQDYYRTFIEANK